MRYVMADSGDEVEVPPVTAEVIEALDQIAARDADGLIVPEVVVAEAEDENSPLHKHFEWDDTEAAAQYRLAQARQLVARVRIKVVDPGPRYVNVTLPPKEGVPGRRGYVPIERATKDPDMFEQVCIDAAKMARAYRARLSSFQRAHEVVPALDAAIEALETNGKSNKGE
jgi:hypothetical protein